MLCSRESIGIRNAKAETEERQSDRAQLRVQKHATIRSQLEVTLTVTANGEPPPRRAGAPCVHDDDECHGIKWGTGDDDDRGRCGLGDEENH